MGSTLKNTIIKSLGLTILTLTFSACSPATGVLEDHSLHTEEIATDSSSTTIQRLYDELNQSKKPQAIIQSVEDYAHEQINYGKLDYDTTTLMEEMDVNFKNDPTLIDRLPRVISLLITKKDCPTCAKMEQMVVSEIEEATKRTNLTFGDNFVQTVAIKSETDGTIPDWTKEFIENADYSLKGLAVPSLMHFVYMKDSKTNSYQWTKLDVGNFSTTLSDTHSVSERANLVYDNYLENLPTIYNTRF